MNLNLKFTLFINSEPAFFTFLIQVEPNVFLQTYNFQLLRSTLKK